MIYATSGHSLQLFLGLPRLLSNCKSTRTGNVDDTFSLHPKLCNDPTVPAFYHLIQKIPVPVCKHLSNNWLEFHNPHICLFYSRGVEYPLFVLSVEIWPKHWVAMLLTPLILCQVLTLEVKHINRESNIGKEVGRLWVGLDVALEVAVVVVKDDIRKGFADTIN